MLCMSIEHNLKKCISENQLSCMSTKVLFENKNVRRFDYHIDLIIRS